MASENVMDLTRRFSQDTNDDDVGNLSYFVYIYNVSSSVLPDFGNDLCHELGSSFFEQLCCILILIAVMMIFMNGVPRRLLIACESVMTANQN